MTGEWRQTSLGALIDIKHGFAFQGEYFRDEPPGDFLLTPGNFRIGGGFKTERPKYYSGPVPEEFVLTEGDLLITMTDLSKAGDTLGYPATVPRAAFGSRFLHNQRLGKVLNKSDAVLNLRFLYYLLCSNDYRQEVLASATGTTVKHTSPSRIQALRFYLPPLEEQRAIAHILGTLDDKVDLNRRMNETLEATARAIFKSWFVDFAPVRTKAVGHDPDLPVEIANRFPGSFQQSELGESPAGWLVETVGGEFAITMGQSPPGETYNEAGQGLPFYQGRADFGFRFPRRRIFCTAPTRIAEAGDTLVSVRAPVGDVNMAAERCCIGRGVAAARHKSGSRSYSYYFMQAIEQVFAVFESEGTVFGAISGADFRKIRRIMPPDELVDAFDRLVSPLEDRIAVNEQQSQTLTALRDTLLPKLVSGEVRAPGAARLVEAASG